MHSGLGNNIRIPTDEEAAALVSAANEPSPPQPLLADIFFLLSGWARRLHHHTTPEQLNTLTSAINSATRILRDVGPSSPSGAAAVFLLGSAAGALRSQDSVLDIAETIGNALLHRSHLNRPLVLDNIENLVNGCAAMIPALSFQPEAACWIFTALLDMLSTLDVNVKANTSLVGDLAARLASFYPAMRASTVALAVADQRAAPQAAVLPAGQRCLEGIYGVLRVLLLPLSSRIKDNTVDDLDLRKNGVVIAAAALAAGGILDGLISGAGRRRAALQPLIYATSELLVCAANVGDFLGQICTGLAVAQVFTACRLPPPTPRTLHCCLVALFNAALDIQPFTSVVVQGAHDVAATNAALAQQAQHGFSQHASLLASTALSQLAEVRLDPKDLSAILEIVQNAARRIHQQYRQYVLYDWSQHAAGVDHRPLQAVLERCFVGSMEVLAAASVNKTRVIGNMGGISPSIVLCVAAELQFCRATSPHYAPLLKAALQTLPLDLSSAAQVTACLPPYASLESRSSAHGNAPVWLVDGVSAAKVQLLFAALVPCCAVLPKDTCFNILAPLGFLYLLHPHQGTAGAAHQLLWALMSSQPQNAQQLVPYYVTRCLEGIPGDSAAPNPNGPPSSAPNTLTQRLQNLSQGLSTAFSVLPTGSPVAVLCVERVLGKGRELSAAGSCWDDACIALYQVAAQQLLTADYSLTVALSRVIEQLILESPQRLQSKLCEGAAAIVSGTENYVIKPKLAAWYQQLAASL